MAISLSFAAVMAGDGYPMKIDVSAQNRCMYPTAVRPRACCKTAVVACCCNVPEFMQQVYEMEPITQMPIQIERLM